MNKVKILYIEILRIIAAFFVIYNHTGNDGFFLFSICDVRSIQFWIYMAISIFCKFAVPVFFMISGALLLARKDESLKDLYCKRIFKIVIILFAFSALNYFIELHNLKTQIVLKDFLIRLYSDKLKVYLWYLYSYISFLVSLPFLKALVKNMDNKYFYYMIGLVFFTEGVLPCIEYLYWDGISLNSSLKIIWLTNVATLYPCLGYFLQYRIDKKQEGRILPYIWLINIISIVLSCYLTYVKGMREGGVFNEGQSQMFFGYFDVVKAITVFLTAKMIFKEISPPKWVTGILVSIGSCCFGIYLWHPIVIELFQIHKLCTYLKISGMNAMIAAFTTCFLTMVFSYIITLCMSKIPLLKRLVGF